MSTRQIDTEITYVDSAGRTWLVNTAKIRPVLREPDNIIADSASAAESFCQRHVSRGTGWVLWPTGTGHYAIAEVTLHD